MTMKIVLREGVGAWLFSGSTPSPSTTMRLSPTSSNTVTSASALKT